MLTCKDYYVLTTSHVFSCRGLKLHSHISISFICHAHSVRSSASSVRSWIKRFPHSLAGGAGHTSTLWNISAAAPIQTALSLSFRTIKGLFSFAQVLFPQPGWKNSPSVQKKVLVWFSAGPKPSLPAFSIQQHLHVPADSFRKASSALPVLAGKVCVWSTTKDVYECDKWSLWKPLVKDKDFATLANV